VYDVLPSFILGFHGCDRSVAERVFAGRAVLRASENDYDWLGHGIYFWENNPSRALDYARLLKRNPRRSKMRIKEPAVVGAVIDLGLCLNLLDTQFIRLTRDAYRNLESLHTSTRTPMPRNEKAGKSKDLLLRRLDCAVLEMAHLIREEQTLTAFDSVRGVFVEGEPAYPEAGIHELSHIQVCVRDESRIKGYFRVRK
jgi:hypothetical protein